ncbi:hypothetical protein M422DRAFT_254444 [Sphaerobolus stellatus SS14]|uniref:Uncharacterized protein n=1 Tax=Sphaerobolus stellatus (strain SS14) TaxID=990650 RepID=A0A0C9VUZ2_SPHS4|nr:hypothetical protein M422DRAFT_254444 [Sphaerobolus stellatus SS14]
MLEIFGSYHEVYPGDDDDDDDDDDDNDNDDDDEEEEEGPTDRLMVYGVFTSIPDTKEGKSELKRSIRMMEQLRSRDLDLEGVQSAAEENKKFFDHAFWIRQ